MQTLDFTFSERLWRYQGKAAWYFITLPTDIAEPIKFFTGHMRRGWGAVRVDVTVGATRWQTSVFPDKKSGSYFLPVKADVRKAESLDEGDTVSVRLLVLDKP